jgi:hypothetical protein
MATRSDSSSPNVLLAIILILTFPVWFSVGAALCGVVIGLFGAAIGVVAALFGVMVSLIALPFKLLFGWGHLSWHIFPHFHHGGFILIALIIVAALMVRGRRSS